MTRAEAEELQALESRHDGHPTPPQPGIGCVRTDRAGTGTRLGWTETAREITPDGQGGYLYDTARLEVLADEDEARPGEARIFSAAERAKIRAQAAAPGLRVRV